MKCLRFNLFSIFVKKKDEKDKLKESLIHNSNAMYKIK